ncbi:glycerophosphodiester phosphodiesterase family protein [Microbacterium sp. RU33B]|uniref:glycerophosphodiester phosphodiesterase n=1 Tax=Microbacterium sp. RU33B TaxID=1907390 RepID=UPI0009639A32|nr:glycerophosphodiester phosphodiesterase family protein [Microbacterium sp. RU33B]SIT77982.1 glycerophosphoryl diester phosphodiesterase [Microbacterium sp. RU33B]
MPDEATSVRASDRMQALVVVCVLAVASIAIALMGVTPARVSATELMGDVRTPGEQAFIASHRGGGATAPENTLPAIEAALSGGFDYVEVDVTLTADRHPVLLHDATVDRTTDGRGRVSELPLDAVRALDAGSWFSPEFAGALVPTFAEFLAVLEASRGRALVELKGVWDAEAITGLVAEIDARDLERRIVVSSFDARSLALARQASEVIPRLVILKKVPQDVVGAVEEIGARGVVIDRRAVLQRPELVDDLHAAGLRVVVYTLNSDTQWDEVTALGVDGIVTDDPGTLSSWQETVAGGE